ncbi:MAG TPA: phage portal protein [Hyphomicrobium sp.]|nr:phage portal protein [Hyphomicrobium sp.]
MATEKRSSSSGFTAEIIAAREAYVSGRRGIAELTATAQSCISMWENCFALGDVEGTDLLGRHTMALVARSVALRGEAVFLIDGDALVPCSDWDLKTRNGRPIAYRLSIPEAGGGRSTTALAGEVLHLRIGCDPAAPYYGTAPLKRASLTASILNAVESSLAEVFENAPIGSQIVPFPETSDTDMTTIGRSFRGQRGRVLLRESVSVSAAGGPVPATDWRPSDVTPDLQKAVLVENLAAARDAICGAFGVLPALFASAAQGPLVREAQRHLAGWTLQPIAMLLAEEASEKLGGEITIDLMRPVQAFDVGGRARALQTIIQALAQAKDAGLAPGDLNAALTLVNWGEDDKAA